MIFQGPNAYVSREWYETRPAVPTWNYGVVHMRGPVAAIHDAAWLSKHVDELVDTHEAGIGEGSNDPSYSEIKSKLLGGIVGFEMTVEIVEAKLKLSQNRSEEDRKRVVEALSASGDGRSAAVAELMQRELAGS